MPIYSSWRYSRNTNRRVGGKNEKRGKKALSLVHTAAMLAGMFAFVCPARKAAAAGTQASYKASTGSSTPTRTTQADNPNGSEVLLKAVPSKR
jgi:hypothetical protein